MDHHSAAYTLEAYEHLIDDDLGPALDLNQELGAALPYSAAGERLPSRGFAGDRPGTSEHFSYPRPMPRTCVFCGGSPVTKEHVWPDWLRRRTAVSEAVAHRQVFEHHGQTVEERDWNDQPFKLTVRAVCRNCNNGWMHQLEQDVEPLLGPMLEGRGKVLHQGGQRRLTTWALKTALMFDQASASEAQAFSGQCYEELLEGRDPPPGTWIFLTAYEGEFLGASAVVAIESAMGGQPPPDGHNFVTRTFSMDRVVFQVVETTNPGLRKMQLNWPEPNIHQLWPYDGSFTWMPTPSLNDEGLPWFAQQLVSSLIASSETVEL